MKKKRYTSEVVKNHPSAHKKRDKFARADKVLGIVDRELGFRRTYNLLESELAAIEEIRHGFSLKKLDVSRGHVLRTGLAVLKDMPIDKIIEKSKQIKELRQGKLKGQKSKY